MSHDTHTSHSNAIYFKIFGALLVLTVVTVALNYFHFAIAIAITLALLVAFTKASLVASFFMHLIAETKLIYTILILTVIFVIGMVVLTIGGKYSVPHGTENLEAKYAVKFDHSPGHHDAAAPQDGHEEEHSDAEAGKEGQH